MSAPRLPGIAFAVIAAVVSGFAVFTNGLAVKRFDDATVYTTAKNMIAGGLLVTALIVRQRSGARLDGRVPSSAAPWLAAIAVIGGAVPFVLFFEGLARATSTNAAFIHKTLVIWVAVGAWAVLRERVTAVHVGAIGLLVVGHVVLSGRPPTSFGEGEVMILAATLLWSAEVLMVKRLVPAVPPHVAAVTRMAGGSALLVCWLAARGDIGGLAALSGEQWAWLALTGTTLSVFVITWYTALSLAPAIDVTAVLVLGAVITGLLNTGFRGVPVTADSAGYILLALGAIVVALTSRSRAGGPVPA
ncbi:DMT family transporter [Ilumatobacter sp.]|uniref:DMT family transporter n=1 Tax=Ilumatobacter sp. TaxID=1967498 RepID=UPI003AF7982C